MSRRRGLGRKAERLCQLLVEEYPAIRAASDVPEDTCVLAAHLTVEAVRAAGGRARPLPCRVQGSSLELTRRMMLGEKLPVEGEEERAEEWIADGAVGFRLGFHRLEGIAMDYAGRYDGHLCALVEERYLIDLSADQFRTHGDGAFEGAGPFWSEVPRAFVRGEEVIAFELENGSVLAYGHIVGDRDYLRRVEGVGEWRAQPRVARRMLEQIGWRG